MKNYTIKMNGHCIMNGSFDTMAEVKARLETMKDVFIRSAFEVVINNLDAVTKVQHDAELEAVLGLFTRAVDCIAQMRRYKRRAVMLRANNSGKYCAVPITDIRTEFGDAECYTEARRFGGVAIAVITADGDLHYCPTEFQR